MTGRSPWGGEGGGCTPGSKEEEGDGTLLPPPQAGIGSTPAAIDTALTAAGIFVLAGARRRACADALSTAGLTATDVADLAAFIGDAEPDESRARKYLAATVMDPDRAVEAIADLGEFRASRKRRHKRGPMPTKPWHDLDLVDKKQREVWQHDRQCRIAYCRVVADRHTVEEVAGELDVPAGTIAAMLDRGRELSEDVARPAKQHDEGETQEERTRRFVEDMRKRREQL